jgi:hypothetical protein
MSSSRSLASARTKRATGNPTIPGNTEQLDQTHRVPVQAPVTKLSLPQAINRIVERLNNLELFSETTTTVVDEIQEFHSNTSNKYIVDKDVFTSLVSRIEALERMTNVKSESGISTTLSTSPASSSVTNDIDEIKSHLIRLQTYVMETNAKLQDMVFSGNGSSLVNFGDIFSDSHPTPPTLIRSTPSGHLETGSISGSRTPDDEELNAINLDVVKTADSNLAESN